MPLFTTSIQNQEQAASAGAIYFPTPPDLAQFKTYGDEFNRETLVPTDAYLLYTTAATGTGTAAMSLARRVRLTTSAVAGDDVDVRTSGFSFCRVAKFTDKRSIMEFNIIFALVQTADTEVFIGLDDDGGAITALPTTGIHLGIQYDASASANWFTTSSGGSQTTEDTSTATSTALVRLRIIINGNNSATMELYTGTGFTTLAYTDTVTSLAGDAQQLVLHFFVQTEAIATPSLDVYEWTVKYS